MGGDDKGYVRARGDSGIEYPWSAPIFVVPKRDYIFRPVLDFWRVNEVTVDDTIHSLSFGSC